LEVLIERERGRKDRTLGQAEAQYSLVHGHGVYDLEVDTSVYSAEACAYAIKEYLDAGNAPHAFQQLLKCL
jgi:chloramphenicol 3-O phosphotransferase